MSTEQNIYSIKDRAPEFPCWLYVPESRNLLGWWLRCSTEKMANIPMEYATHWTDAPEATKDAPFSKPIPTGVSREEFLENEAHGAEIAASPELPESVRQAIAKAMGFATAAGVENNWSNSAEGKLFTRILSALAPLWPTPTPSHAAGLPTVPPEARVVEAVNAIMTAYPSVSYMAENTAATRLGLTAIIQRTCFPPEEGRTIDDVCGKPPGTFAAHVAAQHASGLSPEEYANETPNKIADIKPTGKCWLWDSRINDWVNSGDLPIDPTYLRHLWWYEYWLTDSPIKPKAVPREHPPSRPTAARPIYTEGNIEIAARAIWEQHMYKLDPEDRTDWEEAAPLGRGITIAYAKNALLALDANYYPSQSEPKTPPTQDNGYRGADPAYRTPAKMFGVMPLHPEQVIAPTLATEFEGVEFALPPILGTAPFKYQWYVGAKKITDNATAQTATLSLRPPYTAGVYTCEISNEAGKVTSKTYRLSLTKTPSASDMQFTVKQP